MFYTVYKVNLGRLSSVFVMCVCVYVYAEERSTPHQPLQPELLPNGKYDHFSSLIPIGYFLVGVVMLELLLTFIAPIALIFWLIFSF